MRHDASGQPVIPEPEGDDERETFTFVGFTSFIAQGFEAELLNLAVGLRATGSGIADGESIERDFEVHEKKTLGALFKAVRERIALSEDDEGQISAAVEARNRLTHRFFREHTENFLSGAGRREMIAELRVMSRTMLKADAVCSALTDQLWALLGVSAGMRQLAVEEMTTKAKIRDAAT